MSGWALCWQAVCVAIGLIYSAAGGDVPHTEADIWFAASIVILALNTKRGA